MGKFSRISTNTYKTTRIKGGMGEYPPNYQNQGGHGGISPKLPDSKQNLQNLAETFRIWAKYLQNYQNLNKISRISTKLPESQQNYQIMEKIYKFLLKYKNINKYLQTYQNINKYLQNYQNQRGQGGHGGISPKLPEYGENLQILAEIQKYQQIPTKLPEYQQIPTKLPESTGSRGAWGNIPQTTRITGGHGGISPKLPEYGKISAKLPEYGENLQILAEIQKYQQIPTKLPEYQQIPTKLPESTGSRGAWGNIPQITRIPHPNRGAWGNIPHTHHTTPRSTHHTPPTHL